MCVCISLSAYVTLFCLFSPKVSIILLHPDKNVRKLTMNSGAYKRPFKPAPSAASQDGRNNTTGGTGGTYNGVANDQGSGGPVSTTSQVLNLGESAARKQPSGDTPTGSGRQQKQRQQGERLNCEYDYSCGACLAIRCQCPNFRAYSATCCWQALRRWLQQCCSVGELGPSTARELDSFDTSGLRLREPEVGQSAGR